mgnify:CR=1 FL=1
MRVDLRCYAIVDPETAGGHELPDLCRMLAAGGTIVSLLAGTDSIRDVIAFPKSGGGYDPLTAAPAPISAQQRKEAGVDAKPQVKSEASADAASPAAPAEVSPNKS